MFLVKAVWLPSLQNSSLQNQAIGRLDTVNISESWILAKVTLSCQLIKFTPTTTAPPHPPLLPRMWMPRKLRRRRSRMTKSLMVNQEFLSPWIRRPIQLSTPIPSFSSRTSRSSLLRSRFLHRTKCPDMSLPQQSSLGTPRRPSRGLSCSLPHRRTKLRTYLPPELTATPTPGKINLASYQKTRVSLSWLRLTPLSPTSSSQISRKISVVSVFEPNFTAWKFYFSCAVHTFPSFFHSSSLILKCISFLFIFCIFFLSDIKFNDVCENIKGLNETDVKQGRTFVRNLLFKHNGLVKEAAHGRRVCGHGTSTGIVDPYFHRRGHPSALHRLLCPFFFLIDIRTALDVLVSHWSAPSTPPPLTFVSCSLLWPPQPAEVW